MRDRRGTAAIEFAAAGSMFLAVVLGLIDVGSFAMTQQALDEAVHTAGRYAVVHSSTSSTPATSSSLQTLVQNASPVLTPTQVSVNVTFSPNNTAGSTVTIVASYPWSPFAGGIVDLPATTLTSTSVATILN
jgi:Flp pilus assembly protein TadG